MTRTPHSWLLLEIIVYDGFPETYSQSKMPPPPLQYYSFVDRGVAIGS